MGGPRSCQADFAELIVVVSTLLRNVKIQLGFEDMTNSIFGGLDFYVRNSGLIIGDSFTIFACKIFNIGVESITIITRTIDSITKTF